MKTTFRNGTDLQRALHIFLLTTSFSLFLLGCAANRSDRRTKNTTSSSSRDVNSNSPVLSADGDDAERSSNSDVSASSRSSREAKIEQWWPALWRQQQQDALHCWRSARCSPQPSKLPSAEVLQEIVALNDGRTRRRAAQTLLRAHFLSMTTEAESSAEQLTFRDGDALFLLEDLAQLLTEHTATQSTTLLEHAETALQKRHAFFDISRRQEESSVNVSYETWTEIAAGVAPKTLRNWALEILAGTSSLKTSPAKQNEEILALLGGLSLRNPHPTEGFLVDDGQEQERGIPRCFLGDVSASSVRSGLPGAKQKELLLFDASARAQCRAARRGESARWALAMGSIVERQNLKDRARSWQVRLLATSVLALASEGALHDAAESWSRKALFLDDHARGASYWLSLAPTGETEIAFFAAVLGGAVDHIMAVRHGSAWASKKGRDDVEKTLNNLELVFLAQGIEGVFRVAGEKKASAALLLARL